MPCNSKNSNETYYETVDPIPSKVLYQRRCANYIYVVPSGLRELLSDISREVIRLHPQNLNTFIADYLNTLMVTRENAKVAMRFLDNVTDTGEMLADFMHSTNLTRYQIDKSARIIQRTFKRLVKQRKYTDTELIQTTAILKMMERLKVTMEEANKAATVIQHAYRLYKLRQERRYRAQVEPDIYLPFRHIDWQIAAQTTFDIFRNIRGVHMFELHKAATLIQSAYRGYYTRKFLKDYWLLRKKENVKLDPEDDNVKKLRDCAARVLQRFFRRIVQKRKNKIAKHENVLKSTSTCFVNSDYDQDLGQLLIIDDDQLQKSTIETEIVVTLRTNISKDFESMRHKAAIVIQRFFRRILAKRREIKQLYETFEYEADDLESEMLDFDDITDSLFDDDDEDI